MEDSQTDKPERLEEYIRLVERHVEVQLHTRSDVDEKLARLLSISAVILLGGVGLGELLQNSPFWGPRMSLVILIILLSGFVFVIIGGLIFFNLYVGLWDEPPKAHPGPDPEEYREKAVKKGWDREERMSVLLDSYGRTLSDNEDDLASIGARRRVGSLALVAAMGSFMIVLVLVWVIPIIWTV